MRGSRNFRQVCVCVCVGGGVQVHIWHMKKRSADNVFFFFISLVLNLFYRSPVVSIICQGSSGGGTFFQGGVQLLTGGPIAFFPIETHITCDFPRGSRPPAPHPLWIRPCDPAHRGLIYLLVFLFSFSI